MRFQAIVTLFSLALVLGLAYSQSITITSPNDGARLVTVTTTTVTWTNTGIDTTVNVDIELWSSPGNSVDFKVLTIASSAANTGSYSWLINDYIPNGSTYYILINNGEVTGRGSVFTIQRAIISFVPTWPVVGSSAPFGSTPTLEWTTTGIESISTFTFELMYQATITSAPVQITVLASGVPNTGSETITIPTDIAVSSNYFINVVWEQDGTVQFPTAQFTLFQFPWQSCKTASNKYSVSCSYTNNTFPNFPTSFSVKIAYTHCGGSSLSLQVDTDQSAVGFVAINGTQTVSVNENGYFYELDVSNVTSVNNIFNGNVALEACTGKNCFQLFNNATTFGTKHGVTCPSNDNGASILSVSSLLAVFVFFAAFLL